MTDERTIIIGGGPIGVSTLYELVRRGRPAVLIESRDSLGSGACFANGGVLTPSLSDPWNGPGVGSHLVASLFAQNAAMKLQPHAIPSLTRWGIQFLLNSLPKRHRAATLASFHLAQYSVDQTRKLDEDVELDWRLHRLGTLKTFETEAAFQEQLTLAEMLGVEGLTFDVLSPEDVVQLEPQLETASQRMAKAIFYPDDVSGDAHRFAVELSRHAQSLGAEIRCSEAVLEVCWEQGRVIGVETSNGFVPGREVVIAAGEASPQLSRKLGVRLPIAPAKGYSLTIDMTGWNARPSIPVIDGATHFGVAPLEDRLRCVGVAEFTGRDDRVKAARVEFLNELFERLFPQLSANLDPSKTETWAGLRPMSADGLPFIGATQKEGLWVNAGHGHLGWTMAMGSGALLADLMTGETPKIDPHPYRVDR
ncbi:MAG: FAD-dependent oxidoreductase [Pseudomonadota bacterium]